MKAEIMNCIWMQISGRIKQALALLSSNHNLFIEGKSDEIKGKVQQHVARSRPQ